MRRIKNSSIKEVDSVGGEEGEINMLRMQWGCRSRQGRGRDGRG